MSLSSYRAIRLAGLSLWLVISVSRDAMGIAPGFVSDRELVESPLLVVAKWNGAPRKDNSRIERGACMEYEVATEIEVQRVIWGDAVPGKLPILVGFHIGWSKKWPRVTAYWSSEVSGDAEATKDNLWFLSRKRGRLDGKSHWYLSNYRGVQPLALEPYFKALEENRIEDQIPRLLETEDEIVLLRTLELIAGGDFPWPYEPWRFVRPAQNLRPLRSHTNDVRSLIERTHNENVRRHAAAVYSHLLGNASIEYLRAKFQDEDPVVRAIAIGTLALYQEHVAGDFIAKAVRGLNDPEMACALIKRLEAWHDPAAVAALIEFLQNDGYTGQDGSDWYVPAIKSPRSALKDHAPLVFHLT